MKVVVFVSMVIGLLAALFATAAAATWAAISLADAVFRWLAGDRDEPP